MAEYHSISDLIKLSIDNNQEIWQVVLTGQAQDKMMSERDVFAQMKQMYRAMKSADELYDWQLKSPSGMAGGDGYRMRQYNESGNNICGDFIGMVMEKALKMGESNACMKRIVAAPTAGSCGVIPAVLLSYEKCGQSHVSSWHKHIKHRLHKSHINIYFSCKIIYYLATHLKFPFALCLNMCHASISFHVRFFNFKIHICFF